VRSTATRQWRGVSADQRRAERRAKLIEAGLEVIGTRGWPATTVRSVCAEAGLTERYFYEAFADREALLVAVFDELVAEGARIVLDTVVSAPKDFRKTVRAAISAGVEWVSADPRKGKVLAIEGAANEALQRRRREGIRDQAALLARLSGELFGSSPAAESDAELNALAAIGAVAEIGVAYLDGALDIPQERLVDHLAGVVTAIAGVSSTR
jgi:AcrR family transcriptional regulator